MKRIASVFCVLAAVLMIFPALSAAQATIYPPTATPVVSADPATARPVAVGAVATGGATLAIQVSTTTFAAPMDMYLAIMPFNVPGLPPDIFLFDTDTSLAPISSAAKWRTGVTSASVALLGNIPTAALPQGTYVLLLLVAPAGTLNNPILWQTSFVVGPPAVAPLADAYTWIGNTPLTVAAATGVLANDPAGSVISASDVTSLQGGTVAVAPDGSFVYTPAAGVRGTDSFTYTVTGAAATTVTIQMATVAWYVDNTAVPGGNGSFESRFNTLLAAQGPSLNGDTIFVFSGTGATGQDNGIVLKPDQKLLGQGLAFAFGGTTIVPAALRPVISNAPVPNPGGNIPVVQLSNNNEVAGFTISDTGAQQNVRGIFGLSTVGFNIHDNAFEGLTKEGIILSNAAGTGIITGNSFNNIAGPNPANAIDFITNQSGTLGISNNTFSNVLETCIRVRFIAGTGTVTVTGNTMTTAVATAANARGIDVDASLAAIVTSTISNNQVGSAATQIGRSGIQVNATGDAIGGGGTHRAAVIGNTVINAGADGSAGIEVQASDVIASSICLQMTGNNSSNGFNLDNRINGTFQVEAADLAALQALNTGTIGFPVNNGLVGFVAAGTCGF